MSKSVFKKVSFNVLCSDKGVIDFTKDKWYHVMEIEVESGWYHIEKTDDGESDWLPPKYFHTLEMVRNIKLKKLLNVQKRG